MLKHSCIKSNSGSLVKISSDGKSIVFENPNNAEFLVVQIDGCEIKSGIRADCLVQKPSVGQIILEFKGTDIVHAAKQILATAEYLKTRTPDYKKIAGMVICSQYPRFDASFQKYVAKFRKEHGGVLRSHNYTKGKKAKTYIFENEIG